MKADLQAQDIFACNCTKTKGRGYYTYRAGFLMLAAHRL